MWSGDGRDVAADSSACFEPKSDGERQQNGGGDGGLALGFRLSPVVCRLSSVVFCLSGLFPFLLTRQRRINHQSEGWRRTDRPKEKVVRSPGKLIQTGRRVGARLTAATQLLEVYLPSLGAASSLSVRYFLPSVFFPEPSGRGTERYAGSLSSVGHPPG